MSGLDDPRDELVDGLLGTGGQSPGNDRLRAAVFAKTVGVIRFRRRLKRCVLAASLLGCYLAGMVTTGIWQPSGDGRPQPSKAQVATRQASPSLRVPSPLSGPVGSVDGQIATAKTTGAEVLGRSADRHLGEKGDVCLAVPNYENSLDLSSAEQRALSPRQDTWLLMVSKEKQ